MRADSFDELIQVVQGIQEQLANVAQALEFAKQPHRIKLNLKHATEIRMLYREGWAKKDLADKYGVTVSCVKNVIYGVSWKADPSREAESR